MKKSETALYLAARLRELRKRHQLTQESVAQMSGVAYKYYQKLEGGGCPGLRLDTVDRLAHVFEIEGYELFQPYVSPTRVVKRLKAEKPHYCAKPKKPTTIKK